MAEYIHFNLFYLFVFVFLIITVITICSVIKSRNGNMTFRDMFCKSSDNAKEVTIDTTSKMKDMHKDVVKVKFGEEHELELDALEKNIKTLQKNVNDLNDKVNELAERILTLENKQ